MKTQSSMIALALVAAASSYTAEANPDLMRIIEGDNARLEKEGFYRQEHRPSVIGEPQLCSEEGTVVLGDEAYECNNVDFLSLLSLLDLEIVNEVGHPIVFRTMDIWGWVSPSGREFTIINLDNGVALVDSTTPTEPCIVAKLPTGRSPQRWGDVKVYKDTLYATKDQSGTDTTPEIGIEIYDLNRFGDMECTEDPRETPFFQPDYIDSTHGSAHNVVVDTESGLLVTVGTDYCNGGLHLFDLTENPLQPVYKGCADEDGYTHDAQCLVYDGPDLDHYGKQICLGFNEDTLTIWDLSNILNPTILSRTPYNSSAYTHQGWTNNDLTKVLLDDELNEYCELEVNQAGCASRPVNNLDGDKRTDTIVIDITDLDNPFYDGRFTHVDEAIDHNLYVWGLVHRKGWGGSPPMENYPDPNYAYCSNYLAGLRILDIHDNDVTKWEEVGFFDVSPNRTEVAFAGTWSNYMHPSGVLAVSSIERGLFLLQPRMSFGFPDDSTDPPVDFPGFPEFTEDALITAIIVLMGVLIVMLVAIITILLKKKAAAAKQTKTNNVKVTEASKLVYL